MVGLEEQVVTGTQTYSGGNGGSGYGVILAGSSDVNLTGNTASANEGGMGGHAVAVSTMALTVLGTGFTLPLPATTASREYHHRERTGLWRQRHQSRFRQHKQPHL